MDRNDPKLRYYFNRIERVEGVIVTKERKILFYRLLNDRVLDLSDDTGGECALVLGADAGTSGPWLSLDSPLLSGSDPAQANFSVPKPEDLVTLVNRTDGMQGNLPVSERRIKKFLAAGDAAASLYPGRENHDLYSMPEKLDEAAIRYLQGAETGGPGWQKSAFTQVEGVIALKNGKPMFWKLESDFVLWLVDTQGRLRYVKSADEKPEGGYAAHFEIGGHVYETNVPLASVAREPDWSPGDAAPPTDQVKATAVAWDQLRKIIGTNATRPWRVDHVELTCQYDHPGKWYYAIHLVRPLDAEEVAFLPAQSREVYRDDALFFVSMEGQPGNVTDLGNPG
jgi:hypothetical protein